MRGVEECSEAQQEMKESTKPMLCGVYLWAFFIFKWDFFQKIGPELTELRILFPYRN